MLTVVKKSFVMSVGKEELCAECHYAECQNAVCHYAECHYAKCHYAECHYAECHYAECLGAVAEATTEKSTNFLNCLIRRMVTFIYTLTAARNRLTTATNQRALFN